MFRRRKSASASSATARPGRDEPAFPRSANDVTGLAPVLGLDGSEPGDGGANDREPGLWRPKALEPVSAADAPASPDNGEKTAAADTKDEAAGQKGETRRPSESIGPESGVRSEKPVGAEPKAVPAAPPPPPRPSNPLAHLPLHGAPARRAPIPGIRRPEGGERSRSGSVEHKKLIVGRDIEMSGTISSCDTITVEGRVESNITDAATIEVAPGGTFRGTAEVDHADIAGVFEGELVVHKKLSLARSGRIIGTVRYGVMEVEAGGQIQGTAEPLQRADEPERGRKD